MIQRIQSIYLAVTALLLILLIFTPFAQAQDLVNTSGNNLVLLILAAIAVLDAVAVIFLFNNRKLQLKIVRLLGLIILVLVIAVGYYVYEGQLFEVGFNYEWLLAPFAWVSTFLAQKGIQSDIKVIRSMDRLRD